MNVNAALSAFASDPFAAASQLQQTQVQQEAATKVAVLQRNVAKSQGQAILQLLESATSVQASEVGSPGFAPHKGRQVDLFA